MGAPDLLEEAGRQGLLIPLPGWGGPHRRPYPACQVGVLRGGPAGFGLGGFEEGPLCACHLSSPSPAREGLSPTSCPEEGRPWNPGRRGAGTRSGESSSPHLCQGTACLCPGRQDVANPTSRVDILTLGAVEGGVETASGSADADATVAGRWHSAAAQGPAGSGWPSPGVEVDTAMTCRDGGSGWAAGLGTSGTAPGSCRVGLQPGRGSLCGSWPGSLDEGGGPRGGAVCPAPLSPARHGPAPPRGRPTSFMFALTADSGRERSVRSALSLLLLLRSPLGSWQLSVSGGHWGSRRVGAGTGQGGSPLCLLVPGPRTAGA